MLNYMHMYVQLIKNEINHMTENTRNHQHTWIDVYLQAKRDTYLQYYYVLNLNGELVNTPIQSCGMHLPIVMSGTNLSFDII